jgi:hypothetical protein
MSNPTPAPRPPLFVLIFVSIFGFVGLTVLGFLWGSSGFHEPPLFFKLFGSLIALSFVVIGFGVPLTALFGKRQNLDGVHAGHRRGSGAARVGYKCPYCGAALENQEVSPAGDVKCSYCNKWFNIHAGT